MYNNSRKGLLISNSNESANNENRSNGKAKCNICHLETYEDLEDEFFIYNYKANYKLSKLVQGDKAVITVGRQSQLISPCMCDRVTHPACIRKTIIYHLSMRCYKCKAYFDINYEYKPVKLINIAYSVSLILAHLFIFFIAIVLFIWDENELFKFWQIVIFIVLCVVNFYGIYYSFCFIRRTLIKIENNIIVNNFNKANNSSVPTLAEIKKFTKFLKIKYNCSETDLLQRKNFISFSSNISKEKLKLPRFIKDNNNNLCLNVKEDKHVAHINISAHSYLKKAEDIKFNNKLKNMKLNMLEDKPIDKEERKAFDPFLINTIKEKDSEHYDDGPGTPNSKSVLFDKGNMKKTMTAFKQGDIKLNSKMQNSNLNFDGIKEENSI